MLKCRHAVTAFIAIAAQRPTGHRHDEVANLVVLLRPIMCLGTDAYILDQYGHIKRQQYYDDTGHLLGATATSVVYVGRDTPLLKAPDVRPLLDQLEAVTENYG